MLGTTDLLAKLEKEFEAISNSVLTGKCRDHAEYRYQIGQLDMLRRVHRIATQASEQADAPQETDR